MLRIAAMTTDCRLRPLTIAGITVIGLPLALTLWLGLADRATGALPRRHLERAELAMKAGRYADALAAYGHARELRPTDSDIQRGFMRARAHLAADEPARITAETAIDLRYEAELLLETDKRNSAAYLTLLGNILARTGDGAGAKTKYEAALKADAKSPLAHAALGSLLLGDPAQAQPAKDAFTKVLEARPDHVGAAIALGQLALAQGDAQGAIDRLKPALERGEGFAGRMLLGQAYLKQQKNDEAIASFQRAAQLDPRSKDALRALGEALLSAGRFQDAETALRAAAQIQQDVQTLTTLGFALAGGRKLDEALVLFGQILAQQPDAGLAAYGAGTVAEQLDKKSDAVAFYQRVLGIQAPRAEERQLLERLKAQAQERIAGLTGKPPTTPAMPMPRPPAGPGPAAPR